ncbi:MAG TPA: hypothetical protein VFA20_06295 [Myxococcaceae bacterium]|nr:hypothetical protein [Myxococcaceae bacterium]
MAGERARRAGLGKVLKSAGTETVNLVVAGTAAVGAAALSSWAVAALGGLTYAALVAWDVASPKYWKKVLAKKPPPPSLPAAAQFQTPEVRQAIESMQAARAHLDGALEQATESVQRYIGMSLVSLRELEQRAGTLARHCEDMRRYLATADAGKVRDAVSALERQIAAARDPEAKAQLQQAKAAREDQLRTLEDIERAGERALANLSRIAATIEGLPAKVIKMQALDAQSLDAMSVDLNKELDRMNGEIRAFEEVMAELPLGAAAS